jgi:hypothetical protein
VEKHFESEIQFTLDEGASASVNPLDKCLLT